MEQILVVLQSLAPKDFADIAIVTLLFYSITFLFRGTQAVTLFRGIAFIVIGLIAIAAVLQLQALSWLIANSLTALVIAVPVIFSAGDPTRIGTCGTWVHFCIEPRS